MADGMNTAPATPGEALATMRRAAGLSQAQLGERMGHAGRTGISNMEQGLMPMSREMAERIAKACGADPAPLLAVVA